MLELRQVETRNKLNEYIELKGVKAKFIADNCGMLPTLLSNFRKGRRDLWEETLVKLENFLKVNYK